MQGGSTSRHTLSADRRLSKPQRVWWLACNVLNNSFPRSNVDRRIAERSFHLPERQMDELWDGIAEGASPSRRLCDLFWLSLPWPAIVRQLGRINAFEMGCGSGTYGRLLQKMLGDGFGRYLGVDIARHEQWAENSDPRFAFEVGRAGEAARFLPGANLILTQSALEHFEEDLHYFMHVADHAKSSRAPVLQLHLIPSASCITTFPWHGIREYTPRTISRVTALFGPDTSVQLFSLGGPNCNRVHRKYITWPSLRRSPHMRQVRKQAYREDLRAAILADFGNRSSTTAFYALVLASNFHGEPFAGESDSCAA